MSGSPLVLEAGRRESCSPAVPPARHGSWMPSRLVFQEEQRGKIILIRALMLNQARDAEERWVLILLETG